MKLRRYLGPRLQPCLGCRFTIACRAAGIACAAAHSRSELRAEAAVLHGEKHYTYRFQLCESFYRTSQCSKGVLCDDAHGIDEVRSAPVHAAIAWSAVHPVLFAL